jgi:hypothetical protein
MVQPIEVKDYKVTEEGILLSEAELKRLIDDSYRCAIDYSKLPGTENQAGMLKCEGCANTFEYLLSLIQKSRESEDME